MTHAYGQSRVFERGSNVLEYWLAHADGFEVRAAGCGGGGTVERVVTDPRCGLAEGLVVRSSRRRRRLVPAEAFVAVDPLARVLELAADAQAAAAPTASTVMLRQFARVAQAARSARVSLVPVALAAVEWIVGAHARVRPHMSRASSVAGRYSSAFVLRSLAAAAWVRPRLHARLRAGTLATLALAAATTEALMRGRAELAARARLTAARIGAQLEASRTETLPNNTRPRRGPAHDGRGSASLHRPSLRRRRPVRVRAGGETTKETDLLQRG